MKKTISRRDFLGLMGSTAVVAGLGLTACGGTQVGNTAADETGKSTVETVRDMTADEEKAAWEKEEAYGKTITVGYNGGACLGTFGIADVKGFYADEGLEVEIVSMTSATDGVGSGKVDFAGDHIATLLVPAVNGVKMTFTTGCASGCKSLYVLGDSSYQTTADLADKKVGLTDGIGASDNNIAMRFFAADDVDFSNVDWVATSTDAVVQALQSGELDAAMLSDQFAYKFAQDGTLRIIRSLTYDEDFMKEICCVVACNSDFLEANPVTCKKFTRAFHKANQWVQENKEEAVDLMFENNWASGDKDICLDMVNHFDFGLTQKDSEQTLINTIEDYKKFGVLETEDDEQTILNKVWAPLIED